VTAVGSDAGKHIRNIAILVALALLVWLVPGGSTAGATVWNVLGLLFAAGIVLLGYRFYMEHRETILGLDDRQRGMLYAAFALLVVAIVGFGRMWRTGAGGLLWLALVAIAAWACFSVWRAWREY
jgi:heme/copper-type cytochrome/quinol oxidase subunit 4